MDKASDEIITNIDVDSTITIKYVDSYTNKPISKDVIISDRIGTKVDIKSNKITISFDSEADLSRIMDIMNIKVGE